MEPEVERPPYRVIGVLFKTYILLECEDAFLLIDQHAAHERLRYDELVAAVENGGGFAAPAYAANCARHGA